MRLTQASRRYKEPKNKTQQNNNNNNNNKNLNIYKENNTEQIFLRWLTNLYNVFNIINFIYYFQLLW